MELHHIRYFVALAQELNYTAAAQRCSITRQAMRQALASLEREFSLTFIENHHNRLSLTAAGELFYQKAQSLLLACDDLENSLLAYSLENVHLRLGVSISLLPFYAPRLLDLLNNLKHPFPTLEVERTLADADALLEALLLGKLDAVILVDLGNSPGGLCRTPLRRDELGLLVSVTHPLAQRECLSLRDLSGQTLSLMSRPEGCFLPLYKALKEQGAEVCYEVIPESIEAFQAVRKRGILAMNRLEYPRSSPLALEKDLPLCDFSQPLETVLLSPQSPKPELLPLIHYLEKSCREC